MSGVLLAIDGHIATLTINRAEKRNALSRADLATFGEALELVDADPEVRAVILTATGDKAFSAGVALGDVADGDWTENPLTGLCDRLERVRAPVIAALNGGVYGGGAEIALACDFRLGAHGLRCFIPPARIGIHYEPAGIARAIRVVGAQAARRLFLAVETFDETALLGCGFVDRLVAPESLQAEARALAERVAALAPLAVGGMKRTIAELSAHRLDAEAARIRIAEAWASDDLKEGLAAMRDKRDPRFTGR